LYPKIIEPKWAAQFDRSTRLHDGRSLCSDHSTRARIPEAMVSLDKCASNKIKAGAAYRLNQQFADLHERLLSEMRVRRY
jgi:hypothetical protein